MATTIRLTVLTGPHKGARFCTQGMKACLVGRAPECQIRFCGETRDLCISRFHCQLLLDLSRVRVHDMDSANGTYINGHRVGDHETADGSSTSLDGVISHAKDGDILTIGGTSLQVNIMECDEDFSAEAEHASSTGGVPVRKNCSVSC